MLQPAFPIAEIRHDDERAVREAQDFLQHALGELELLQGLAQDGVVERVVRKLRQAVVEVPVNDGNATPDAGDDALGIDLHPLNSATVRVAEIFKQTPIAAAQVDHAAADGNVLHDHVVG